MKLIRGKVCFEGSPEFKKIINAFQLILSMDSLPFFEKYDPKKYPEKKILR